MPESPGVSLPGDSAPGLCQLDRTVVSTWASLSRQSASKTTTTTAATTTTLSVRGWLHVRISHIFYVKVELWILRSILVSLPANMAEEEVAPLVVNNGSDMHSTGFANISAPRAVFPTIVARSACAR